MSRDNFNVSSIKTANAIHANGNCGLICDLTTENKVLSFFFSQKKKNEENENVLQPENTKDTLSQKVISFSSI